MEASEVNKLITKALSPVKSSVTKLKAENTKLKYEIEELKKQLSQLNTGGIGNINLTDAIITIDPIKQTIKIETDAGNIETKVVQGVIAPVVVDEWCKKAAQQYLKDNLDLAPNGVTVDTARNHYELFGKREGRTWKKELCK